MFTGVCSVKFTYHILYRPIRLLFGSSYIRKTEATRLKGRANGDSINVLQYVQRSVQLNYYDSS